MKTIFILFISFLFLQACSNDKKIKSAKEEFQIVGYWKVDSVQVFRNDSLIESTAMNYYMEFTENEIRSCNQKEDAPKYEISESKEGRVIIVKTKGGNLESKFEVLGPKQMKLIKPRRDQPNEIVHWYHRKSDKNTFDAFCRGELSHNHHE